MNAPAGGSARFLLATFGSAGDLLPMMVVADDLRSAGAEVRWVVNRSLGLWLRMAGEANHVVGDGIESRDGWTAALTRRFDGWSSIRRTLVTHIAPTLGADAARLDAAIAAWRPDAVVASGYAVAARVAAMRAAVPVLTATIYPSHFRVAAASRSFARPFLRSVEVVAGPSLLARAGLDALAWGLGQPTVLVNDPQLLGAAAPIDVPVVGYPYRDQVRGGSERAAALNRWLASSTDPAIVVTLGSFLGIATTAVWQEASDAIRSLGIRAAFIGGDVRWAAQAFGARKDIRVEGFVPQSEISGPVAAVVHHGGLGTTLGAIRKRLPAVVVPQAFDQPMNARLVEAAGAGRDASGAPLIDCLGAVLDGPGDRMGASRLADRLVPSHQAAAAVSAAAMDVASRGQHG